MRKPGKYVRKLKIPMMMRFRTKLILVAISGVLAVLIFSSAVSVYSFIALGRTAYNLIAKDMEETIKEYMSNYITIISKRAYKTFSNSASELLLLNEISQTMLNNRDDMDELGKYLLHLPYFKNNFHYNPMLRQLESGPNEPTIVIVPEKFINQAHQMKPDMGKYIQNSEYLDMIMPAIKKTGTDKLFVYMLGPPEATFLRFCPYYPNWHSTFNFEWEKEFSGLIDSWKKQMNSIPEAEKKYNRKLVTFHEPYLDKKVNSIVISALCPLWGSNYKDFQGAVGIEVRLDSLRNTIQEIKLSDNGFAFISQPNGNVLIISEHGSKTLGLNEKKRTVPNSIASVVSLDRNLRDSSQAEIRSFRLPRDEKIHFNDIKLEINGKKETFILATKCMDPLFFWSKERGLAQEKCVLGLVVPEDEIYSALETAENELLQAFYYTLFTLFAFGFISLAVVSFGIFKMSKRMTLGISTLVSVAEKIKNKDYNVRAKLPVKDEIGQLGMVFDSMAEEIQKNTDSLEEIVRERTNELEKTHEEVVELNKMLRADNMRLGSELDIARRLQMMVLPKIREMEKVKRLEISSAMIPANEVGGDYYDVIEEGPVLKIGIGDITGHGLESGVMMMMVQTAAQTLVQSGIKDPEIFINTINRVLYKNAQRIGTDKNLSLLFMDYEGDFLTVCGQHEELIIIRANSGVERHDTMDLGFPVGLEPDIATYLASKKIPFSIGDTAVLFTDGITEAQNAEGLFYGIERLCKTAKSYHSQSAIEIKNAIIEDLILFIGNHDIYDDITLIVMKPI
ncbi:MAG: hypothetical protein A2017_05745 [Lentisphaerae bacterium GWF2_44_16]|nr:MAG: hypothetical protein A2017_05745 [Lentisphaerae bacterium GWF2_44_16]